MNLSEFNEKTYQPQREYPVKPEIICNDGFKMSAQGSQRHYSNPQSNSRLYSSMEIGYPSEKVEEFMEYAEDKDKPTDTVYGYVPSGIIQKVIEKHGGINYKLTSAGIVPMGYTVHAY